MTIVTSPRNVGIYDGFIRTLLGIGFLQVAYFWLSGTAQTVAYTAGALFAAAQLDGLLALAKEARLDELPAKGEALKSSFVKVYLARS